MIRAFQFLSIGLGLALLSGCITVTVNPPDRTSSPAPAPSGKQAKADDEEKKDPFKPWDEVLEDTRSIEGFLTTHLKRDRKLYLELDPEFLEHDFGLLMHYSRGLGVFNVHDGLPLTGTQLLRFRRVGDTVYLQRRNPRFTADKDSPMRVSLDDNVGHSLVASFEILSKHAETGHLLLDLTGWLVSDYPGVARRLKNYYDKKPVSFDKKRSFISEVKSFPKNVELDVELTFNANSFPDSDSAGVSDYRSIPVGVRFSLFALPESPMQPRLADDRVGYFLTAMRDFSADRQETSFLRFIEHWRLEKANPNVAVSEPVKPIVYYVDRTVPTEYREYVKQGIEAWNKGFEAAGFKNAIVGKYAPDMHEDPDWSAEDVRYSTVRWSAAHRMGYAIGPSQVDPRTGEILNADVLISSTFVRSWLFDYQEWAGPEELMQVNTDSLQALADMAPELRGRTCNAASGKAHELSMQYALLVGLGELEGGAPMPEEFLGDAIRDLVMHEVGHTLGLRHNFRSSGSVPYKRLNDTSYTGKHGLTHSVMDYNPVNVAVERSKQGDYFCKVVGDYDVWAIQYGYSPIYEQQSSGALATTGTPVESSQAERVGLDKIARRAAEPGLAYGTDEDNWLGPYAVDPLTNAWDLGSDPLAYLKDRVAIVNRVQPKLERRLIASGEGYQRLRNALSGFIRDRFRVVDTATKMVGASHVARDHKGDPNARPAFRPLSAADQRRAVKTITDAIFAPGALSFEPELLNKLTPNRWSHWGMGGDGVPVDYPVHELVLSVQRVVLDRLLDPARLQRLLNTELRMPAGSEPYRLAELFETLSSVIWDKPSRADSMRRNLQRVHIDRLSSLLLNRASADLPSDARSLARLQLAQLDQRIDNELAGKAPGDVTVRAHLSESQARIRRALDASLSLTLPLSY